MGSPTRCALPAAVDWKADRFARRGRGGGGRSGKGREDVPRDIDQLMPAGMVLDSAAKEVQPSASDAGVEVTPEERIRVTFTPDNNAADNGIVEY